MVFNIRLLKQMNHNTNCLSKDYASLSNFVLKKKFLVT